MEEELIETRTLWKAPRDLVTVECAVYADNNPNWPDFGDPEQERDYNERYNRGGFRFVGLVVEVTVTVGVILEGRVGEAAIWGTEHGTVAEGVEANAWDFTPAQYPERGVVIMASPLAGTVAEALGYADDWLNSVRANTEIRDAIKSAQRWADPNNPKYAA